MKKFNSTIDNAISNLDDALSTLISETDLSGTEIYELILQRVEDTYEYFNKPKTKCQELFDLFNNRTQKPKINYEETVSFLKSEDEKQSNEFDTKNKKEDVQDKSISSKAYEIVVDSFAQELNIDVRQVPITAGLVDFDGLDLFYEDVAKVWNKQIREKIIRHAETRAIELFGQNMKEMWNEDNDATSITVPAITEIDAEHMFTSVFDVMYLSDHWIDVYTCHFLKTELIIKNNYKPSSVSAINAFISSLESKIIHRTFGQKNNLLEQPVLVNAMKNM